MHSLPYLGIIQKKRCLTSCSHGGDETAKVSHIRHIYAPKSLPKLYYFCMAGVSQHG